MVFVGKIQSTSKRCKNNDIQQGRFQRVIVKKSDWGYGAFAASNIAQGAYIGDYIGELENQAESDPEILDRIQKFLGLNYSFELFDQMTIDARNAGNETRYLNHGNDDKANCVADVINVHNTQRIVLQTNRKIKRGKELLLNYGENYWKDPEGSEDEAAMRDEV
ncbi:hypothetical protein EST38_g1607 [Candolleomyces aberdarensis]|uniref:SET domain-containing protein n=1 Tax=Candolleomyces aberdarensis TaxID=2316362 RepID=A0A4Q2DUH9_9AGAR|nr:hypothetical protein EST38_g1607 [Candolleomyces aberdarensis]